MMHKLFLATALAVLSACASNFNLETATTYSVGYSEGGDIEAWERLIDRLNAEGKRVVIGGTCISACTMLLSADNVCVHPKAVLGFHGATAYPGDPRGDDYWTARIAARYPGNLGAWFYGSAADKKFRYTPLYGWQVSRLSGVPICK